MASELQQVFEFIERERGIDRETLLHAVETALLKASKKAVSPARELRISVDRKTFEIKAFARVQVVEAVKEPHDQITLPAAKRLKADVKLGDFFEIEVTPKNFGRIAAQTAKQTILQEIRAAEKAKVYKDYKDRPGDIVSGTVRGFERSDVLVDLGRAEAVLPSSERVPIEEYQIGDRLRALLLRVEEKSSGPQLILSRSAPEFVRKLFALEVAEINDNTVEIKAIAREPGYRTKLAVFSNDQKVDPVGACVGMRGLRVKNIVRELSGEKIDIVRWNEDIKTFVTNALSPAKLLRLTVDEETGTVNVIVAADQLSLAIGKKGQNARLTSKLTGWRIDIAKDEADISFEEKVAGAIAKLAQIEGIGQAHAEKLVHAGFLALEGIVTAEIADLAAVEGFDEASATAIKAAAEKVFEAENQASGSEEHEGS
jgi:N utilization substance protein A